MIWPALLLAPTLALMQQALAFSLVTPSCGRQEVLALHAVSAASTLLIAAMLWLAVRAWRKARNALRQQPAADYRVLTLRSFLAVLAMAVGGLALLVGLAMWVPVFILSPCAH